MNTLLKKLYIYIAIFCFVFSFFSCTDTGLGEEIDLEPPVLALKSMTSDGSDAVTVFGGGVFCHKSVTFSGNATDNNKISRVWTQLKWSDETDFHDFKSASVSGSSWALDFTFEKEGTAILKFLTTDPAGNIGTKSTKTIILFVDEDAPVGNAWYIDRKINGIQYRLHDLEYLKNVDLTLAENKDAAQNVAFSISGAFTDTMGVSEENPPSISIFDESGNKICSVQKTAESNIYQPVFEITHDLLTSGNDALSTGKHYLQVRYTASDVVTTPSANSTEDKEFDGGWFIWWPESDIPRYELSEKIDSVSNSITVFVNSTFSITIFDDDALAEGSYEFSYKDQAEASQNETKTAEISAGEREKTLTVKVPSTPQTATLSIKAKGKSGETDKGETVDDTITVNVIDATAPMLLITSPKNNSVPKVTMTGTTNAKVTISGTSLDASGCNYLEFVWVPNAIATTTAEKSAKAKAFLESLTTDEQHASYATSENTKKTEIDGLGILWSVPLTNRKVDDATKFVTQTFSFDIDLFTDFGSENKTTSDKFFVARLIRSGNTGTTAEYKLAGDISNPTISPVTPSGDMAIVSGEEALVLEFKGEKESGMPMDTSAYEIRRVDSSADDGLFGSYDSVKGYATVTGSYDTSSGTYKASEITGGANSTLSQWKEKGTKPKFQFIAKDLLGNEGKDQYTIVISTLPVLKSVTSPSSTLLKKGDELLINAVFDNTISVSDTSGLYVKLANVTNGNNPVSEAKYKSGSGSTTLVFSYIIQEGDASSEVQIDNSSGSPLVGIPKNAATLLKNDEKTSIVEPDNLLQKKKTIVIDGISPKATVSTIVSDITSDITNYQKTEGEKTYTYLKAGRKLTATVTTSEDVFIQGNPTFVLNVGTSEIKLPFTGCTNTSITFSKTIESTDSNGTLTYIPSSCISDHTSIVDAAGNTLSLPSDTSAVSSGFAVDTGIPATPTIKEARGGTLTEGGKYANSVSIKIPEGSDKTRKLTQYSTDGGSTWSEGITEGVAINLTTSGSYSLTARRVDYAGNESPNSTPINFTINNTFPDFSIECIKADGNYKAGSKLVFKVTFNEKVKYSSQALYSASALSNGTCAYIQLSALNLDGTETCGGGSNKGRAYLSDKNGNPLTSASSTGVDSVFFTYEAQDPDEFRLKVAADGVKLNGFTDEYGIAQGDKGLLGGDYEREKLKCDGVAPKVTSMTPDGSYSTSDGINVYSKGNKITLKFKENVQKASGNIILRQVAGWAIPPVLSGDDFSTVLNAIPSTYSDSVNGKTGKYILCMDELEDMEDVAKGIHYANDNYHGTGQYVGPYKKSSHGLTTSGSNFVPDTTTKYVLDFDYGIWETTTTHYIGQTFKKDYATKNNTSSTDRLKVLSGNELSETRTVNQLRAAFEAAGYHERVLDVTDSAVVVSDSTVTITFPAGLCDESSDLPYGRKWELVIEKGAFIDETGNEFGAEADGTRAKADAVQTTTGTGKQYTVGSSVSSEYDRYQGHWARAQETTNSPVVLVCDGENEYFFSDKVATPVVRVDRYSYGLGIYQSDANGTRGNQIISDAVKPTGYVRVRIDCETDGAEVKYTKDVSNTTSPKTSGSADQVDTSNGKCESYITSTSLPSTLSSTTASTKYTKDSYFAVGNGNYNQGFKGFVIASATKTGLGESSSGYEGVFQTVAWIYNHTQGNGWRSTATIDKGDGYQDLSVRGTTGWGGEPAISPFPLRDSRNGSPYLRRAFRENTLSDKSASVDYYWVSYEILVGSSISGYSYGNTGGTYWGYNWSKNWGYIEPGETSYITGMQCWESY